MLFTLSSIIGTVGAAVILAVFLTAQSNRSQVHWASTLAFIAIGAVFVGVIFAVFHPAM